MGKRRKRQTVKQIVSWILVASLTAPSTSVLAAEAAEQVKNAPRYVDFSRPAPLSLQEAGISSLNQKEDSGTGKTEEKEEEKQEPGSDSEKTEPEEKPDSSGGQDKEPSADKEEPEEKPEESDKPSADKEESGEKPEESDKPSADKEESEEKPEESENPSEEQEEKPELPEESEDSSEGQEDETLDQTEEPPKGSEEDSEESEDPEEEEFPEEPEEESGEKPAEPLEEIPLEEELPVEEELRAPEEFYDVLESAEPDGELVQFSDFMRTYRTGDKEYTTVIGGYSGLYEKEDGTIGQTDDTLITVKEKRRLEKEEKESEKMDETDAEPETGTEEYGKATGSDAGKQNSDIEEDSAAEEGFMDYMISSSDLANTAGELEIQIPSRPSSSRGIRLKNGEAEMELLPKGGNFRKSAVEGNAIRFNEVYENVDYQYTIIGNTLKEDIILMEPSERTTFVYELEIPGMTAKKEGNAVAVYQKNEETPAFMLDAPFMEDDDGERSDDLELRISGKKDRVTVTVEADKKWLQDEDREYPVRIDPSSLVPSNELILCTVSEGRPSAHYDWGSPSYVGYVDSSMKNCRQYLAVNMFDDANMQDILNSGAVCTEAVLELHQETDNSQGNTVLELGFPVEGWNAYTVTWNSKPAVSTEPGRQIFANSAGAGNTVSFDFTEVMNAWIAKTEPQGGFMLKAQVEADGSTPPEYRMKAETFSNTYNSSQGPKITLVWEGELQQESMDLNNTTIDVSPSIGETEIGGVTSSGVLTHGRTQEEAEISWELVEKEGENSVSEGICTAEGSFIYPDFTLAGLEHDYEAGKVSNWQAEEGWLLEDLELDTIYYVEGTAEGYPLKEDGTIDKEADSITVTPEPSDEFLLYEVQQHDLVNRIARHYGVNPNTIAKDNHLYRNQLAEAESILFIRNPETAEPYSYQDNLTPLEELLLKNLLAGANINCELGLEPINFNTGSFYMTQEDFSIPELNGAFGVTRSYNSSLPEYHNEFGYGWSSELGGHLSILPDGTILYKRDDGKGIPFYKNGDVYEAPEGYGQKLEPMDSIELDTATDSDAEEIVTAEDLEKEAVSRKLEASQFIAKTLVTGLPRASDSDAEEKEPEQNQELDADVWEKKGDAAPPACAGWKVTEMDGTASVFDSQGFLQYREDRQGRRTSFVYSEDYDLLQIKSPTGKLLDISMDEKGRITAIELPDHTGVSYEYDEDGNLVQYTNQAGDTRRYEYDENHRMTAWYDENGTCVMQNVYDSENRVIRQTDGNGNQAELSYIEGCTSVTDNNGHETNYYYDAQYRTVRIEYPDGSQVSYTYGEDGYRSSETDEAGAVISYTYDTAGNLLTETREDGAVRTYTYNEQNQPLTASDWEGNITVYTYDEKGNCLTKTDPMGNVTAYAYDEQSRLVSVTDPNGGTESFVYDGAVVIEKTDPEGFTSRFTYDAMNRLLTQTDGAGYTVSRSYNENGWNVEETAGDGGTTVYEYSPAGEVLSITDPMGAKTSFTYDPMHNILSGTDALGNTLTYAYDGSYNKISETDALGRTTSYAYDSRNRLIRMTDAKGQSVSYTLDARGNQIATADRRGNAVQTEYDKVTGLPVSSTDALGYQTSCQYDKNGRILSKKNPDGSTKTFQYDLNGRLIRMTAENGLVTELRYDGNGNMIRLWDDETREYTFAYNRNNQLVKTVDPLGNETKYTYDGAGNQISEINALGNETSYSYDGAARLTKMTDALDGVTATEYDLNGHAKKTTDANGHSFSCYYDAIGELKAQTDAMGSVTAYQYDAVGNVTQITDALKGETKLVYDELNQPISVTDALDYQYETVYDENGNMTEVLMPDGDRVFMEYDANNQLVKSTDEAGVITFYTYDKMGRVTKTKDTARNTMLYGYDEMGNLIWQSDTIGRTAFYEYDRFGRLVSRKDFGQAETRYEYDVLDQITKIIQPDGTVWTYEYDGAGNLIKNTEPGEAVYTYEYDQLNRVIRQINPIGAAEEYVYDPVGNLLLSRDGEGAETSYAYDALNRLTALTDGRGNLSSYEYDELSRLLSQTTPEGNRSEYRYDALGRMTKEKDPNGLVTENRYDALGNLTETISPKGAKIAYTYDKHDELTSETDPAGNTILYQVDLNRQVTKLTQKNGGVYTYEYDLVHRLTGMTTPLGLNQAFSYDLADNVTEETDNLGRTVSYKYDSMHRMTSSTNAKGGVTQFAYDERGNQTSVTDPSGYTWISSYDLANQLIGQTDPEGKATKYTYNLAGRLLSRTKPGERTAAVTYDKNYNVISLTDPKGYVYSYTYDKDNRQTEGKDPLKQSVKTAYDPGSRVTAVTDKMGLTEQYEYDPHGNIIQRTDTKGLHTRFQYDILDNLTSVTDPMNRKTSYTYDVMGNILTMTDPKDRVTSYTYDLEGNLTSLTSPMGRKETYEYDAGGRQIQKLNPGGSRIRYDYDTLNALADKKYEDAQGEESDHPVQMGYNSMGQRISMEDITGGSSYTYDSLGRLKTAVNGSGKTVSYEYDEADNLGAVIYPDGKRVSYEYDKNDNITRLTDRDGRETSYKYDPLNRLTQVRRPDGTVSSYTYNARNQVLEAKNTCVCGFLISDYQYTYDDGGLIIEETAKECLFTSNKDYGHQGGELDPCIHASTNPWQNQNPEWETTERRFTYDENGQLLTCQESKGAFDKTTYTYEYDEAGNRTFAKKEKLYSYLESWQIRYTYNDDNQMTAAKKREGNLTKEYTFTYDANGNLLRECFKNKPEVTYQYDTENRLKAVSDPQKLLMASTYDGDGNRAFQLNYNPDAECGYGKNVNGEIFMPEHSHNEDGSLTAEGELFGYICSATGRAYDLTEYVNDTNREHTEVLTAFNINTGFDTESYTYAGSSRLSRNNIWNEARDVNHDEMSYYLYDGQGSVTANTWYNGMVTDVYQYDPYGRMELGGEGHTDFYGYRAESYNPNTGLEYLRARYYNADKGKFFQDDTYLGDITDPLTLNRYAYVKNSPLNYADPSGHVNIPGAIAGALLGGVGGAAESFILQMIFTQDVAPNELAGDAVAGAVVGGLEGAFSGKVPRWLKSFAQSKVPDGIMTAATYVVSSLVSGEKIEKFDLAAQFIAGMVGGTLLEKIGGNVDSVKYAKDIIESISVLRKPVYNQTWKSGIDYYLTQLVRATVDWLNSGLKYIGISVTLEEVLNIFDGFKTDLIKLMDQALGLIQSELCNFIKDFRHEMQKN